MNNRFIDFTDTQILVTYLDSGSLSPDLYVITGLSGITGLTLVSDTLGISTIFSDGALGLLVSGTPQGPGSAVFNVNATAAVPETASWAMFIGGFGAIGYGLRRRRTSTSFA